MSEVVENQIVKMSFDNKEFEKNIDTSIKSLETLKSNMEFSDESKNFKNLEKSANSLNFDGANKAIDNINDHFTILGRTAFKVADSIAEYFSSKLIGAFNKIKSVSTDLIDVKAGYSKYDEYTRSVKTIMSSLGEADKLSFATQGISQIEGVEKALSDLMLYTDETSYSFNAMADTIGKFMGAGISLESAVQDMQGIANWAALAGQNATVASQSMYQMSQALGRGNVQYSDWKEMANIKNMGTVEAKSVFIEAAQKKGTIRNEDIAKAKSIKGANATDAEVNNWFFESEQLNDQAWFTTDVLEEGLHMMSLFSNEAIALVNNYDDLEISASDLVRQFDKYKKAVEDGADETKAFEEVTNYFLKDIEKGSDTYDEVYAKLKLMASAEYDVGFRAFKAAQQAVTFSDAIEATRDAVGTKFVGIFDQIVGNYEEAAIIWTDLSNALWDIFAGPLDDILSSTKDWKNEISEANGEMTNYQYLWDGIYRALGGISKVIGSLKSSFLSALFGREGLTAGELAVDVLNSLAKKLNNLGDILESLYTTVEVVINGTAGKTEELEKISSPFLSALCETLSLIGSILRSVLTVFKKVTGAILEGVFGGLKAENVLTSLLNITNSLLKPIEQLLSNLVSSNGFNAALRLLTNSIKLVIKIINTLMSPIKWITSFISGKLVKVINFLSDVIEKVTSKIQERFGDTEISFSSFVEKIKAGVDKISDFIGFDLLAAFEKVKKFFVDTFAKLKGIFQSVCDDVLSVFPEEFNKLADKFQNGSIGDRIFVVLEGIGAAIGGGIGIIVDAIGKLFGVDLSGFSESIIGFVEKFVNKLSGISPEFKTIWEKLKEAFLIIWDVFSTIVGGLIDILTRVAGKIDPQDFVDWALRVFENLLAFAGWFINVAAKGIEKAGPFIIKVAELIGKGFECLWLAINYIIGTDDTEKAKEAAEKVKKLLTIIAGIFVAKALFDIVTGFKWLSGALSDFAESKKHNGIISSLAKSMSYFVIGIGIILIGVGIIMSQDPLNVLAGTISLAVIMKALSNSIKKIMQTLTEMAESLSKNSVDDKSISKSLGKATKVIIKISVALLIISFAVRSMAKAFGKTDEEMAIAVISIVALQMFLVILTSQTKRIIKVTNSASGTAKNLAKAVGVISAITAALYSISLAIVFLSKQLQKVASKENGELAILMGVGAIVGSLLILSLGVSLIMKVSKFKAANNLTATAKMIGKIGITIIAIALAVKIILETLDAIDLNGGGEGGAESSEGGAESSGAANKVWITLAAVAGSIILLCGGIALIAKAANSGKKVVEKQGGSKQILSTLIGISIDVFSTAIGAIAITIAAGLMVGAVMGLSFLVDKLDFVKVAISLGAFIVGILVIVGLMWVLGKIKIEEGIVGRIFVLSASMILITLAVTILCGALLILGLVLQTNMKYITDGAGAIALLLVALVGLSILLAVIPGDLSAPVRSLALTILTLALSLIFVASALAILGSITIDYETVLAFFIGFTVAMAALAVIAVFAAEPLNALGSALLKVGAALLIFIGIVLLLSVLDQINEKVLEGLRGLETSLPEIIEELVVLLAVLLNSLADSLTSHAEELAGGLINLFFALVSIVISLLDQIFTPLWQAIKEIGANIIFGLLDGISSAVNAALDFFKSVFEGIINFVKKIFGVHSPSTVFADIGGNLLKGLWQGISDVKDWIVNKVKGVGKAIVNCFKDIFGIHSPSTVLKAIGGLLMDGLDIGLTDGLGDVLGDVTGIGNSITDTFTNSISLDNLFPDMNSMVPEFEFDATAVAGFDANSLGLSDVYDMDVSAYYRGSGVDIPTNYEPTITDGQLSQLSSSYDDSNQSVVDAIAELKNQMAEMTEQIKSYQMVLDTGVLVGELAAPMDKALGTKNRLAGRGV